MGIKLVIADDAPFIREALKNILSEAEYECVGEASSGDEAIKIISLSKPELVILDLVLPEKNGIEVCKEIKEIFPKIKVVACSTEGQEEMILKAVEAGCSEFIKKPFTKNSVLEKIASALGR